MNQATISASAELSLSQSRSILIRLNAESLIIARLELVMTWDIISCTMIGDCRHARTDVVPASFTSYALSLGDLSFPKS